MTETDPKYCVHKNFTQRKMLKINVCCNVRSSEPFRHGLMLMSHSKSITITVKIKSYKINIHNAQRNKSRALVQT
jgi:hypothetical protein